MEEVINIANIFNNFLKNKNLDERDWGTAVIPTHSDYACYYGVITSK
jgi:hypothetical protein